MKSYFQMILATTLLTVVSDRSALGRESSVLVLSDFEGPNAVTKHRTTHESSVSVVSDVPPGGGKAAAKIDVGPAAGTENYFGAGFPIPAIDLSRASSLELWIRTDIEGTFSLAVQSEGKRASAYRFLLEKTQHEAWQTIRAPVGSFEVPNWANGQVDWTRVTRWQVTAHGDGSYDGRYLIVDNVVGLVKERGADQVEPEVTMAEGGRPQPMITLSRINGRHWLVDSSGHPFFAHGITHVNNGRAKIDFDTMSARCRELGFNAYGYGTPPALRSDMPYVESWNHLVPISTYRSDGTHKFVDIFDPAERARLEAGVKASCGRSRASPNCIGYCWTDLGAWPLKNSTGTNWVEYIRSLPEEAAGRKEYQTFLDSWEGADKDRDQAFLRRIAAEYFRVIGSAQRKYDPDHLVFGDRFAFNTLDPDVLLEMLPWVDAIAIQPHFWGTFPKEKLDKIYRITGKPILLCDFAIRFKDGDQDVRMHRLAKNSVDAGKQYTKYVKAALDTDYILGTFWCNPVDTPKGFRKPGVKQGFFGPGLTERPGLHDAVKNLNAYRDEVTPTETRK